MIKTGKSAVLRFAVCILNSLFLSAFAEDLVVPKGETQTISSDATYDTVTLYGTLSVSQSAKLTAGNLVIMTNGVLNLNGSTTSFASIDVNGLGYVKDDRDASHATIKVTGDGDSKLTQLATAGTALEKSGAGTLTLAPRNAMNSLTVSGGKVVLQSRAAAGYRWYQLQINGNRGQGSDWNVMQMAEYYWFDKNGIDLSGERIHPLGSTWGYQLYDRDLTTKLYQNRADGNTFSIVFPGVVPIRSYMYWTAKDEPVRDPSAWTILASVDGASYWDKVATVTGFAATTARYTAAAPVNFQISAPSVVTIPTVKLDPGTALEVSPDTTLAATNLTSATFGTAAYCKLSVANDGALAWSPSAAKTLVCPGLDGGGTFRKEGAQNVTIYGDTSFTGGIHVVGGTLAMRTAYRETHRFFKFVFEKSNTTKLQFSELALYNANGERVNQTANISYISGSWHGSYLFDGNNSTDIYHDNNFPSTPGQVSFELNEGVTDCVTAYRFCQSSGNGGWTAALPSEWKVYARADSSAAWELIDSRSGITSSYPSDANMWKFQNGGVPFTFTNKVDGAAAFAPSCKVRVDGGATLDVSGTGTVLANLVVDCSAATDATIVGGTLAATGEIALENVPEFGNVFAVPLAFVGTEGVDRLANWTFTENGRRRVNRYLAVVDGRLTYCKRGLVLIVE